MRDLKKAGFPAILWLCMHVWVCHGCVSRVPPVRTAETAVAHFACTRLGKNAIARRELVQLAQVAQRAGADAKLTAVESGQLPQRQP